MSSSDKNWAHNYLIDPLTAPDPSDETGPGSQMYREPATKQSSMPTTPPRSPHKRLSANNPYRNHGSSKEISSTTTEVRRTSYPSPPASRSPRGSPSLRQEALNESSRPRRSSSLRERFPGDPSVHPLDQLSKEKAEADKARHITRKHHVRPDSIDKLDASALGRYHHEGPYDATLFARNNSYNSSPVAAVASTNTETLKATPREKVADSLERHRPLDGVAAYPPGTTDRNGHTYQYEQGENMMVDLNPGGGSYKRWEGIQYHPDDIKGKGEPSYSIEKALKDHSLEDKEKRNSRGTESFEMTDTKAIRSGAFAEDQNGLGRSSSLSQKLKKRVSVIKNKLHSED